MQPTIPQQVSTTVANLTRTAAELNRTTAVLSAETARLARRDAMWRPWVEFAAGAAFAFALVALWR